MDYIIFVVSLAVLIYGADLIISQSEKIALRFGLSEYLIGATLIAVGTSLPEMAASISASLNSRAELAVSNIIGSNILNITLVLGVVLFIAKKVDPHRDFFAKDSSWALFPILILIALVYDTNILDRFSGLILLSLMVGYLIFLIRHDEESIGIDKEDKDESTKEFNWFKTLPLLIVGFLFVIYGADYMVESASNIARELGVSEWIIGVVLVSLGTSMPELVVSIVAAIKNKADMAIGNIIGSNMANISVALGTAAVAKPIELDFSNYTYDILIMLIATLMLIFITANKLYSKASAISLLALLVIFLRHIASSM